MLFRCSRLAAEPYTARMAWATRLLLALLVFSIPFDQSVAVPGIGSLARLFGLLAVAAAVLTVVADRSIRLKKLNILLIVAAAFVACNAFSIFWTIDRAATFSMVLTYVQLWVMLWIFWQFTDTPQQAARFRFAYMLGALYTIGMVVTAFIQGAGIADTERFTPLGTNANYTAQSIVLAIPMALHAAAGNRGWRRWAAIILFVGCVLGVALTGSRSGALVGMVSLLVSVFLIVPVKRAAKLLVIAGIAVVIVIVGLIIPEESRQRFLGTAEAVEAADFTGREDIWRAGLALWSSRPAQGIGAGAFETGVSDATTGSKAAHNSIVNLIVELGPMGPVLFILMFVAATWPHLAWVFPPRRRGSGSSREGALAKLQVVLLLTLFLAQQPANWQYSRATWFILTAATLECAVIIRADKRIGADARLLNG